MTRHTKCIPIILPLIVLVGAMWLRAQTVTSSVARVNNLHVKSIISTTTFYVHAAIGNDNNSGTSFAPWKTLAKIATVTFPPNAIIDGYGQVYYERLLIPANDLTIRNLTIDGTVSVDGGNSYTVAGVYTNNLAWGNVSGEIWSKTDGRAARQMFEDGTGLTPLVCADEADVTSNLARGQFSFVPSLNTLYYRATDGANPSTHALRVPNRAWDANDSIVGIYSKTNVTFQNVTIRNYYPVRYQNALFLSSVKSCVLSGVTISNCGIGFNLYGGSDVTLTNCISQYSVEDGFMVSGNLTNIQVLSNAFIFNGRTKSYDGSSYQYTNDLDGIGIGQTGLNGSNVAFVSCLIASNGPPDSATNTYGSGLYAGTINAMSLVGLTVTGCRIYGNHNDGLYHSTQVISSVISNNIFAWNAPADNGRYALGVSVPSGGSTLIASNLFYQNDGGSSAACLSFYVPTTNGPARIIGNTFFNDGLNNTGGNYYGDIRFRDDYTGKTNITESGNTFQRVAPMIYLNRMIVVDLPSSLKYTLNELATWQTDSAANAVPMGIGDVATTNGPALNPTTLAFP